MQLVQSVAARVFVLAAFLLGSAPNAGAVVFSPKTFLLSNGMQVVVVTNRRAPIVAHMVWYKIGAADGLGRAEMRQQGFFAPDPNAWHLVKRGGGDGFGAFGPMGADGKPVRFVAQPLNKIQHRIIVAQGKGALPDAVELFFAVVAINAFCYSEHWQIVDAKVTHDFGDGADLTGAAVDQKQIWPQRFFTVGVVF